MIKGFAQRRLDRDAWEVALIDADNKRAYTIEFKAHPIEKEGFVAETSLIPRELEMTGLLKALADALNQMEIFPDDATTAELKATKFHLEDMRKLVFIGK